MSILQFAQGLLLAGGTLSIKLLLAKVLAVADDVSLFLSHIYIYIYIYIYIMHTFQVTYFAKCEQGSHLLKHIYWK